ncbi:MAG: hypothetical protein QM767_18675 [Anaeromyxobacter sp.]
MEFFGDRERLEAPRDVAEELAAALLSASRAPAGPQRHAALGACLARAGELAQGLGDAEGGAEDGAARGSMRVASRLGRALWRSWRAGGRVPAPGPRLLATLLGHPLPDRIRTRRAEGFGLYALYPETYALAGQELAADPPLVVGLRSIGTALAAMVAAGAGSRAVPCSVRPAGHPYQRSLSLPAPLRRAAAAGARVAVVDEGPGLSGSSLAAVATALLEAGAAPGRVHLFTSHPWPPGSQASPEILALYQALPRHFVPLERLLMPPGPLGLARLAEDVLGRAHLEEDLAGGAWRARLFGAAGAAWPPSQGWMERRKWLLRAELGPVLARFAGLGRTGELKLARARALAAVGLAAPPLALRHGLLFERWLEDARPLPLAGAPRPALREAARRLVTLSAARPREGWEGASPARLAALACANAAEALGPEAGETARRLEAYLPALEREARPVEVDGKLQAWEWLVRGDGRLAKADGVDHHAGHDRAGCQDALWDVAGAQLELGLTEGEALRLAEAARQAGPGADPSALPFYRTCLAALEVGRWSYAAAAEPDGPERRRRDGMLDRYRRLLAAELERLARGPAIRRARGERALGGAAPPPAGGFEP